MCFEVLDTCTYRVEVHIFRRIMDEADAATEDVIAELWEALKAEFPAKVTEYTEGSVQTDMES